MVGMAVLILAPVVAVVKAFIPPAVRFGIGVGDMIVAVDEARRNDGFGAGNDGSALQIGITADVGNFVTVDNDTAAFVGFVEPEDIAAQDDFRSGTSLFASV